MEYHLGFYVHHHGSGHMMRSLSIAKEYKYENITFLGSRLKDYKNIIPQQINCIDLPLDIPLATENTNSSDESCLNFHYAPINVMGIRERNLILTQFFTKHKRLLFIVDTSAEVVALGRLCSVPVVIIQQHGDRNDLTHQLAYDSAVKVIAPFPEMLSPNSPDWVKKKTFYAGGFSKYNITDREEIKEQEIGVLVGSGGTSIDLNFLLYLANQLQNYKIKAIGHIYLNNKCKDSLPANLELLGRLSNPLRELNRSCVVIGNAGNNTVMEAATLNKRFICIPEDRPFNEQLNKAKQINKHYGITYVLPEDILSTDWTALIVKTLSAPVLWGDLINSNATQLIRQQLDELAEDIF